MFERRSTLRSRLPTLAVGLSLTFFSSFGQTFFVSLFVPYLLTAHSLGNAEFGLLYAVATLSSALVLPWAGAWMDRTSLARFSMVIAAVMAGSGLLLAGGNHLLALFVGLFGLRLAGPGLAALTALTEMARRHASGSRGRALGISSLGFSIGEAVLPLLGTAAIAFAGWRGTWVGVSALSVFLFAPLFLALISRANAGEPELEERPDRGVAVPSGRAEPRPVPSGAAVWDPDLVSLSEQGNEAVADDRDWTRREMLRDPRFWFALPAALLPPFWATGIFLYQTGIGASRGWSAAVMASAFTAFAVTRVVFSLAGGETLDRFGARTVFSLSLLPLGIAMGLLMALDFVWVSYAFMACIGVTTGVSGNARVALWAEMYGLRHLGSIKSLMAALVAVSTAGSPVLVGAVIDSGAGLDALLWGGVLSVAVASALTLGIHVTERAEGHP